MRYPALLLAFLLSSCSADMPSRTDPMAGPTFVTRDTPFCPECWKFLTEPVEIDSYGECRTCHRRPLELEAISLTFYACNREREWRKERCGFDAIAKCCLPYEAAAVDLSPPENGVFTLRYCPGCRKFAGIEDWPADLDRCPHCDWTSLEPSVVFRSWTWCKSDLRWRDGPCRKAAAEGCCSEKSGVLLARPAELSPISIHSPSEKGTSTLVTMDWVQRHLEAAEGSAKKQLGVRRAGSAD